MLRVGKLTDYASWVMSRLACDRERPCSAVDMAAALSLPLPTVSKVLKKLTRAGFLKSVRGVEGGYILVADLEKTSLVQLIDAMEGPFALTECDVEKGLCGRERICQLSRNWQVISHRVRALLAEVSIAELCT